jgi:hypothetical protein
LFPPRTDVIDLLLTKNNSPYLLGTVKPASAWLTNYWATTHYSESNYVALTQRVRAQAQPGADLR